MSADRSVTQAKRLVLVRHAKSSWADSDLADHERPLKGRGRRAAGLVGRYLRDAALLPDLVLCSSATRARDTLTLLELPAATDVHIEDELYDASADDLLARLRLVPPAVGSVLLIGHNPAVEILTWMLVDPADRLPDRFPTAAVAEIRLPAASWREVELHGGRLGSFVVPRDLEGTP